MSAVEKIINDILALAREDQEKVLAALEEELREPPPVYAPTQKELERRMKEHKEAPDSAIDGEEVFQEMERAARGEN